jgi:hypothetical protein
MMAYKRKRNNNMTNRMTPAQHDLFDALVHYYNGGDEHHAGSAGELIKVWGAMRACKKAGDAMSPVMDLVKEEEQISVEGLEQLMEAQNEAVEALFAIVATE